ncbi:MAG: CHAT domain-containing protein [Bacteroidales bacterium]|nr:CHAT domain-containing protein [Bacteroidales bacterium]
MKKFLFYLSLVVCFAIVFAKFGICQTGEDNYKQQYSKAVQVYKTGDYETSMEILLSILEKRNNIDTVNLIVLNNMLGVLYRNLGDYENSIIYYNKNIQIFDNKFENRPKKISKTYNNLGNVYKRQGKYSKAIECYNEAVKIIINSNIFEKDKYCLLADKYYNIAIVYFHINNFNNSIKYYYKSLSIKKEYKQKGIDNVYFNLAQCYTKLNYQKKADYYFNQAIKLRKKLFGKTYYRMAPLYMNYGNFLREQKKIQKAKFYLLNAKTIYEQSYGKRHPYTANSYVYIGKYYTAISKHDSSLYWYQKSLIANSKHFNSEDIRKNPDSDDCFSCLQLLKGLKMKAKAIQNIANDTRGNKQIKLYNLSLKTTDIALNLISKLRKDYISTDSKLIITEEEKECYSLGVTASTELHKISEETDYAEKAYKYASGCKASVLSDNMEEEREINVLVPISARNKKADLEHKISGYKKLIFEENEKLKADSSKINKWKTKLFELNNEYDVFIEKIKAEYHIPDDFKKNIISIKEIQKQLPDATTLVEYFISKDKDTKKQYLCIFVINSEGFRQFKRELSNSFEKNIEIFKNRMNNFDYAKSDIKSFNKFNKACYELYFELIEPIKNTFNGKNIIIVPDENIAYISFDALLSKYKERSNINYADLHYLIYDYCFSYAYSTPLLMRNTKKQYSDFVYAFAPDYNDTVNNILRQNLGNLTQTKNEIKFVLEHFNGKAYIGNTALEDSFKAVSDKGGVLHLAMHASVETDQKEFSFLAFTIGQNINIGDDGLLYAYEIDRMKIISPMVVLSACNTGNGKLYSGEGIFSLSRSFIKAGVPAVVYSLWNVNDDAGSKIMQYFYENLAKGMTKNNALRNAKLEYIKVSSPTFINPVYWSGYVITGDVSAVKKSNNFIYYLFGLAGLVLIVVFIVVKRKKQ